MAADEFAFPGFCDNCGYYGPRLVLMFTPENEKMELCERCTQGVVVE